MRRISPTFAVVGAAALVALTGYAIGTGSDGAATAADRAAADRTAPVHRFGPAGRPGPGALAGRLGVDEQKLRAALEGLRGELRPRERPDFAAELAKELGVAEAKIEAAIEKLRERHQAEHRKRREAFAQKLADKLGIPVEKVKDALPDRGGIGGRGPRGDRGGGGPPAGRPGAL